MFLLRTKHSKFYFETIKTEKNWLLLLTNSKILNAIVIKLPFFKIRKILKPSFLGLQAWFPRNETLIQ